MSQAGVRRRQNQDQAFVDSNTRYFIVADGVSSSPGGAIASSVAVNAVSRMLGPQIGQVQNTAELTSLLGGAIRDANQQILNISAADKRLAKMATTIVIAAISDRSISVANVGDARAYAVVDGQISLLSHDHSAATDLIRHHLLRKDQLREHPFRNIITRSLGGTRDPEPFVRSLDLNQVSSLLLCTDGIWAVLDDVELFREMNRASTLEDRCAGIIGNALRHGSDDDLTCVLVDNHTNLS
jgi:protein phosphatase